MTTKEPQLLGELPAFLELKLKATFMPLNFEQTKKVFVQLINEAEDFDDLAKRLLNCIKVVSFKI